MKKTQPIKERLNAHLDMLDKLNSLKLELAFAYDTCKSPNYSGMPRGGKSELSETEAAVQRKLELEKKIEKKQSEIDKDWAELEPLIEQLKPMETLVMNLRYYYGSEWEDVCKSIYGRRKDYELELDRYMNSMYKTHGRALLSLSEMAAETE